MSDPDLSFVAPHRRAEVLRRILIIERFIAAPGRAAAQTAATELGLRPTQFYNLVKIWKSERRPEQLSGSGRPRDRAVRASVKVRRIVEERNAALPGEAISVVATRAIAEGRKSGIDMPGHRAVRRLVELLRAGRVVSASPAAGADVVIATCAIDIPIRWGRLDRIMPVATMVIAATDPPATVGVALSVDVDDPAAAARALIQAFARQPAMTVDAAVDIGSPEADSAVPAPSVAIPIGHDPRWTTIVDGLRHAGVDVRIVAPRPGSTLNDAVALLGRKPAGFMLRPGLTSRPARARRPTVPVGAAPLPLLEAEMLVRNRLVRDANPIVAIGSDQKEHLLDVLRSLTKFH